MLEVIADEAAAAVATPTSNSPSSLLSFPRSSSSCSNSPVPSPGKNRNLSNASPSVSTVFQMKNSISEYVPLPPPPSLPFSLPLSPLPLIIEDVVSSFPSISKNQINQSDSVLCQSSSSSLVNESESDQILFQSIIQSSSPSLSSSSVQSLSVLEEHSSEEDPSCSTIIEDTDMIEVTRESLNNSYFQGTDLFSDAITGLPDLM